MALREINLVPNEVLHRKYLTRHLTLWAGCLTVSLTLILGVYLYQTRLVAAEKSALSELEKIHANLEEKIEEIKNVQAELKNLSQQQAAIETKTRNLSYASLFTKLADIMNVSTWLTKLVVDSGQDKEEGVAKFELTGFSLSNEKLGDFLSRLSAEPLFEKVLLRYAKERQKAPSRTKQSEPMRLIEFRIECYLAKG